MCFRTKYSPALHICNDTQLSSILHLCWKCAIDSASISHWSWSPGQQHRPSRHYLTIAMTEAAVTIAAPCEDVALG
jgi:hypothetical protein